MTGKNYSQSGIKWLTNQYALHYISNLEIKVSGGFAGGVTPVPIPNTEVKPSMADDTWTARSWESRLLPDLNRRPVEIRAFFISLLPCMGCSSNLRDLRIVDRRKSFNRQADNRKGDELEA